MQDQTLTTKPVDPPTGTALADNGEDLVCPGCGYSLRALPADRCPECGLVGVFKEAQRLAGLQHYQSGKKWCAAIAAVILLIYVLVDLFVVSARPLTFLASISAGFCAYLWIRMDRALHRYPPQTWALVLGFFLAIIGVPLYLVSHSRWRSLAWFLAYLAALFGGYVGLGVLCVLIYWALGLPLPF